MIGGAHNIVRAIHAEPAATGLVFPNLGRNPNSVDLYNDHVLTDVSTDGNVIAIASYANSSGSNMYISTDRGSTWSSYLLKEKDVGNLFGLKGSMSSAYHDIFRGCCVSADGTVIAVCFYSASMVRNPTTGANTPQYISWVFVTEDHGGSWTFLEFDVSNQAQHIGIQNNKVLILTMQYDATGFIKDEAHSATATATTSWNVVPVCYYATEDVTVAKLNVPHSISQEGAVAMMQINSQVRIRGQTNYESLMSLYESVTVSPTELEKIRTNSTSAVPISTNSSASDVAGYAYDDISYNVNDNNIGDTHGNCLLITEDNSVIAYKVPPAVTAYFLHDPGQGYQVAESYMVTWLNVCGYLYYKTSTNVMTYNAAAIYSYTGKSKVLEDNINTIPITPTIQSTAITPTPLGNYFSAAPYIPPYGSKVTRNPRYFLDGSEVSIQVVSGIDRPNWGNHTIDSFRQATRILPAKTGQSIMMINDLGSNIRNSVLLEYPYDLSQAHWLYTISGVGSIQATNPPTGIGNGVGSSMLADLTTVLISYDGTKIVGETPPVYNAGNYTTYRYNVDTAVLTSLRYMVTGSIAPFFYTDWKLKTASATLDKIAIGENIFKNGSTSFTTVTADNSGVGYISLLPLNPNKSNTFNNQAFSGDGTLLVKLYSQVVYLLDSANYPI